MLENRTDCSEDTTPGSHMQTHLSVIPGRQADYQQKAVTMPLMKYIQKAARHWISHSIDISHYI